MGTKFLGFSIVALLFSTSCTLDTNSGRFCTKEEQTISVYIGGSFGAPGLMKISPTIVGASHDIQLALFTVPTDPSAPAPIIGESHPSIVLTGKASCIQDKISVLFSANSNAHQRFKVLGGKLEGVYKPEFARSIFGLWDIDAFDKENNEEIRLEGYFRDYDL